MGGRRNTVRVTAVRHAQAMPSAVLAPDSSTADLLTKLRGDASRRPVVDPGLAGGLRDWLEDGLATTLGALPPGAPVVRVSKETLNQALACEAHLAARRAAPRRLTGDLVRGILVDAVFRQWVTAGHFDAEPFDDALAAVECDGDRDGVGPFVAALPGPARQLLAEEVARHAAIDRGGMVRSEPRRGCPAPRSASRSRWQAAGCCSPGWSTSPSGRPRGRRHRCASWR